MSVLVAVIFNFHNSFDNIRIWIVSWLAIIKLIMNYSWSHRPRWDSYKNSYRNNVNKSKVYKTSQIYSKKNEHIKRIHINKGKRTKKMENKHTQRIIINQGKCRKKICWNWNINSMLRYVRCYRDKRFQFDPNRKQLQWRPVVH